MAAVILPVTVQDPEAATPGVKEEYPRNNGLAGNRLGRKTDDRNNRTHSLVQTFSRQCVLNCVFAIRALVLGGCWV